jgi:hypothetical protein
MTGAVNLEPAHLGAPAFTDAVNAAADLPFHLTVWTVVDVLDAPEHLRVTAGRTELATMSFDEAHRLGTMQTAVELGHRARRAYECGLSRDVDAEHGRQDAAPA